MAAIFTVMKRVVRKTVVSFILLLSSLLLAIVSELFYFSDAEYRIMARRTERVLERKSERLRSEAERLRNTGLDGGDIAALFHEENGFDDLTADGMTLLAYLGDTLLFWSDATFDITLPPGEWRDVAGPVRFQNGYFLIESIMHGDTLIAGLIRIYSLYDIDNRLLRSGFNNRFRIPDGAILLKDVTGADYIVHDAAGEALFGIGFPPIKENTPLIVVPVLIWTAVLTAFLMVAGFLCGYLVLRRRTLYASIARLLLYSAGYAGVLLAGVPDSLANTELFDPTSFYHSANIPTMGHLLLLAILLFDLAREFNRYLFRGLGKVAGQGLSSSLGLTLSLFPGTIMVILFHQLFVTTTLHPNIVFEGYRINEFSFLSVVGIVTLLIYSLVPALYYHKIVKIYGKAGPASFISALLINAMLFAVAPYFGLGSGVVVALFSMLLLLLLKLYLLKGIGIYYLSALFSLLFAGYSVWYVTETAGRKEQERMKVMALSLSSSHDEVAEYMLHDINMRIETDPLLEQMMVAGEFGAEEVNRIAAYLSDIYFSGYWTNYDFNVIKCNDRSLLYIGDDDETDNCFDFFDRLIDESGRVVTGTNFYFLDLGTGRPSYIGVFYYPVPGGGVNALYIELISFVNAFREGFPELLIDRRYMRSSPPRDYSFAKYVDDALVLNTGPFPHWKRDVAPDTEDDHYLFFERDEHLHLVYRNGDVTVIMSRPVVPVAGKFVSFAWMFLFSIVLCGILARIFAGKRPGVFIHLNFRQKMQTAFMVIILVTFAVIAAGASYLSIEQHRTRHMENIREKSRSLNIELEHKLLTERDLYHDWSDDTYRNLSELLVKFSNVYFTDLNLYDTDGWLLATSRPEVFMHNLTSIRMDKYALLRLSEMSETEHIKWSRIGDLEYLSMYIPFYNDRRELLAYLHIPYFGMQSKFAAEVGNLVAAIVNFSLIMILLTMGLAVFISERITSPIRMMGSVLSSVRLGSKIKRIEYHGRDEIGDLVKEYNKMVGELEESARKLSATEREYAWREMARQVAHEIKNPLTPMKLNVQQLLKSWSDKTPGFEKRLTRFTKNQIEYIDNLSSIATAFSDFARMPKANPSEVDIMEQIKIALELFRNSVNITFKVSGPSNTRVFVWADSEHLNSIFSNLLKNGIQAIPQDREGVIKIAAHVAYDRVSVSVTDNGCGIPEELKEKMFTPYFTTKSSGSGLGLNIVKRLVEVMEGDIYFESESGTGTTFTVTLPVLYTVENG